MNAVETTATAKENALKVMDELIASTTDPELRATRQLLSEYFFNEEFRKKLEDYTFEISMSRK